MIFQQIRGATIKITYAEQIFLIDPWLSEKGALPSIPSPFNKHPNPLVDLPLTIEEVLCADAVIVTHMHHFDHFDEAAQKALPNDMRIFTQSEKEVEDMRGLGFTNVTALRDGGVDYEGITLFRTDCEHGRGEASRRNYEEFGLPDEASGFVFIKSGNPTVYVAGDTVWCDKVEQAINRHRPEVIILNAAEAAFYDGTPILMGTEGVRMVASVAPKAVIVASHMDAVNHARLNREALKKYVDEKGLSSQVRIPYDGETYYF